MRLRFLLPLALLAACGDDGRTRTSPGIDFGVPPGTDAQVPPGTDAQVPPGTDARVPPGTDGGPAADPIAFCQIGCASVVDCGSASAAFDSDNYACESGACRYTGCNSDAECASSFSNSAYVCRDLGGQPTCQLGCASVSDCAMGSAAFDADNYTCEGGVCRYQGCNSDAECTSTFMDSRYGCREAELPDTGIPLPTATRNCVLTCATVSDCEMGSAAFDSDNYECDGGVCRYRGCNDDGECASSFMDSRYLCR